MNAPNPALADLEGLLGGDKVREVVRTFLQTFGPTLHELSSGDNTRQQRAAHSLKSSARQLGAEDLSRHMAALEERLRIPGQTVAAADLAEVARMFTAAAAPLRAYARS
jgi:HPt (histidine-containing phosphotransfer) domain-containing protein